MNAYKVCKTVQEEIKTPDIADMYVDFSLKYKNVFIIEILGEYYIYRSLGRSEYKEILEDNRFNEIQKEELICTECLLYPNPEEIQWGEKDAGVPAELVKNILKNSYLGKDSTEERKKLHSYYRAEMYDIENQITCIISEAFPNIDIEEIEAWDVDKTLKYLSRAEWKLQNLRGFKFAEIQPETSMEDYEQNKVQDKNKKRKAQKDDDSKTIRGGSRKDKLTPEKLKEREEFLRKFPEFANDDIINHGIDGLAQDDIDDTPPALRPGW